jgi:hypothetical protein
MMMMGVFVRQHSWSHVVQPWCDAVACDTCHFSQCLTVTCSLPRCPLTSSHILMQHMTSVTQHECPPHFLTKLDVTHATRYPISFSFTASHSLCNWHEYWYETIMCDKCHATSSFMCVHASLSSSCVTQYRGLCLFTTSLSSCISWTMHKYWCEAEMWDTRHTRSDCDVAYASLTLYTTGVWVQIV